MSRLIAELLLDAVRPFVGEVPGAVVGVVRDGEVPVDAVGSADLAGDRPLPADELVRIGSNTKPPVAVLALAMVVEGVLGLADPVDRFVPELAHRRVLRRLDGPLSETVAADRPPTWRTC